MDLLKEGLTEKTVRPTAKNKTLRIDNISETFDVYQVQLDKLFFNDQNDRIATSMSAYRAQNKGQKPDLNDLEAYNDIIHDYIDASNPESIKKTQTNIENVGQLEPGVALSDGRLIDGNRRFTCLRNIQKKTGLTQYMDVVILDHNYENNAKQIKLLELFIQHGVDKQVDYNPIDRLVGIYNDIVENQLLTAEEYASTINISVNEIKKDIENAKRMIDYLEFMGMPKQYHMVRNMNFNEVLRELDGAMKKCKTKDQEEDLKNIVFASLVLRPVDDMRTYVRNLKNKIVDNPTNLANFLKEQSEFAEAISDALSEKEEVTEKVIRDDICSNEALKDKMLDSTDKFIRRSDSAATRNRPGKELGKAIDSLESLDINILKKLNDEQKEEIEEKLKTLEELITEFKEKLGE